ncbi:MAG: nucleic acid-binding protein, contains PIN domain [Microgenomates group bacterium Gr01-1014_16]|nr:MAG: nucleic acid-binding protein, contains PIN domain [Microgenomates group bacterium Gr01-1014_16]
MTKTVFIDTSAWLAFLLSGEKQHQVIDKYVKRLISQKARLFTSDYILDETWTRLVTNQNFSSASSLRQIVKEAHKKGHLSVFFTLETFFEETWQIFEKFSNLKLSFTDATIIFYSRKFKIDEVVTLDEGIKKAGLKVFPN